MGTRWLLSLMTWTLICTGLSAGPGAEAEAETAAGAEDAVDAREGDEVTLACRAAPPGQQGEPLAYYWVRSTPHQPPDNVAVGAAPLQTDYRVVYTPQEGRYDLVISNATYERDNGRFECRVKAHGSGRKMHSQAYQLVVLRAPSPPRVEPAGGGAVRAQEGRDLRLDCSTSGGSPEPTVKWYRESSPYPLESNVTQSRGVATLQLRPTRGDDGATYRCVVWNRALPQGRQLEASVQLSVDYYPRVTVGPSNPYRVEVGSTARLQCSAEAKPAAGGVRWSRRGHAVNAGHTDGGVLELRRVAAADGGEYVCAADNGLGRPGEATLVLDVQFAPAVSLPAATHEVEEGGSVHIHCNVSANPPPHLVEWTKEGDDRFRRRGADLALPAAAPDHAGTYTCRAHNTLAGEQPRTGAASVALLVRHRPGRAVVSPEQATAQEGAAVALTCAAAPPGWPAPQYRWFRAPPAAAPAPAPALATGDTYTIPSVHLGSEGEYYCQATNELGHGEAGFSTLLVQQPPRFQSKLPPHAVRRAGEQHYELSCAAAGKPRPAANWRRADTLLQDSAVHSITEEEQGPLGSRSTLRFNRPLTPADRGLYSCVFRNDVKAIESAVMLKIEHEPIVVDQRELVAADPGETGELQCRVLAYPAPRVTWRFAGAAVDTGDTAEDTGDDVHVSRLRVSASDSALGEYECRATNDRGVATATVRLQRKGPPAAPSDLRASAGAAPAVTLAWRPGFDGGLPGTRFFVSYRRAAAAADAWLELDCGRANPCDVTGLDQHEEYVFKVKAVNTKGQSAYSNTAEARTGVHRVPAPELLTYDPGTRTLAFRASAAAAALPLRPRPQRATARGWTDLPPLPPLPPSPDPRQPTFHEYTLQDEAEGRAMAGGGAGQGEGEGGGRLRLRLCLTDDSDICSEFVEAEIGPSYIRAASTLSTARVAAIVVSGLAFVAFVALLAAFCLGRRARQAKRPHKMMEMTPGPAPPPYYPSSGMENAALERSLELSLAMDECGKQPYHNDHDQYYQPPAHHHNTDWGALGGGGYGPGPGYSPLQGARAPSEHSQDSLWQLKRTAPPPGPHYDDYPPPAPAPAPPNCCADPYASVHKPKKRPDQMMESPYHEVSGLPDTGGGGGGGGGGLSLSYDESLESGYSTPNSRARRVIREIIV